MVTLVAFLAVQAGSVDPSKDPAYAQPITVEVAMQPLRNVVAAIAKASGKPVDVSGAVLDLKATVLVKDLPVGRTMEALADTMDLQWKNEDGVLRLSRPEGQLAEIATMERDELATAQRTGNPPPPNVSGPAPTAGGFPRRGLPIARGPAPTAEGGRAVYTRFNPFLLGLEVGGLQPTPLTRLRPAAPSGTTAFAKAAAAWPGIDGTPSSDWSKPVTTVLVKSPWDGGELSLADLLVAWHAATGLPVVADAFRVPLKTTGLLPMGALADLQSIVTRDGFALRLSDGVARMRHPAFWRLREQEIPEPTWTALERGRADLGTLAAFASRLNAAQAASFHSDEAPLSRVPTTALREAYPALLLWNTLSGDARDAVFAGRPVGLAQTPGSKDAYAYALREAPYYGAGDPAEILRSNPAKVGLFGQASDKSLDLRLGNLEGSGVTYVIPL